MSIDQIRRIDPTAPLSEPVAVAADRLRSGNPLQALLNAYSSADECFHCGQWSCEPGAWRVEYSEDELCHLLQGRIRLIDETGGAVEFGVGDSFVIPAGFRGIWETLEPTRKVYVIYEGPAIYDGPGQ
jgi:uncharacterized cupin superfamily protein